MPAAEDLNEPHTPLQQPPTVPKRWLIRPHDRQLESEDVAFRLAPRLNAAGRMGKAASGIEMLTTADDARAEQLAAYIHELNSLREHEERSIQLAAAKQAKDRFDPEADPAVVLAERGWHPGVIGIVAGRLAEKWHRPVVMIAQDPHQGRPATGSVRSVPGFDVHTALAGLTLESVSQVEKLAPFGQGNRRPVLCASSVHLAEPPRAIGGGGRHISMNLVQHGKKLRGVAFGGADWLPHLPAPGQPFHIAFKPKINEFRGRGTAEMEVVDWRPDGVAVDAELPPLAAAAV